MRALEEGEVDEASAADRLLTVLRKLIENFEGVEDEEGGAEMLDTLEEALTETTKVATKSLRGGGHAGAFDAQAKLATKSFDPEDYEVDDGRDLYGVRRGYIEYEAYGDRRDAAALSDELEQEFEDPESFPRNPNQIDDGEDDDGRDFFGRRVAPLR
ncbi:MAG: hypothetical protein M3N18_04340 [Actinomycetota bacterium]|nr:hypothetical protein [Actinomycetota bacterium]